MKQTNFLAVIGDVIGSRAIDDRAALQDKLRKALNDINHRFTETIASRFVLTIGDEFQGLLSRADQIHRILTNLRVAIHPVEIRMGLGIGSLTTPLREEALGMDGPCFHRARDAIQRATIRGTQIEVVAIGDRASFDLYSLLTSGMRADLTPRQRYILDLSMSGLDGREIADKLSISPSAVSQHLSAAKVDILRETTQRWLQELIDGLQEGYAI